MEKVFDDECGKGNNRGASAWTIEGEDEDVFIKFFGSNFFLAELN